MDTTTATLVERLRALGGQVQKVEGSIVVYQRTVGRLDVTSADFFEAADRIEALERENERLREGLGDVAVPLEAFYAAWHDSRLVNGQMRDELLKALAVVRGTARDVVADRDRAPVHRIYFDPDAPTDALLTTSDTKPSAPRSCGEIDGED